MTKWYDTLALLQVDNRQNGNRIMRIKVALLVAAIMAAGLALASPAQAVTSSPSPTCTTAPGTTVQCHSVRISLPPPSRVALAPRVAKSPAVHVRLARVSSVVHVAVRHSAPTAVPTLASTGPRWRGAVILALALLIIGSMALAAGRQEPRRERIAGAKYDAALKRGLSDREAREEGWPQNGRHHRYSRTNW